MGRRGGNGELLFNGQRVSVWDDEKVLEVVLLMVVYQCECISCHLTTIKNG